MALRQVLKSASSVYLVQNVLEKPSLSSRGFISFLSLKKDQRYLSCGMASSSKSCDMVVPKEEVIRFIRHCMCKAGTTAEDAETVAHHLMYADYRGHFSHGLNRMTMYAREIKSKLIDPAGKPEVISDFQATALVSGYNSLGQVVGKFCMELAISKAQKFGIGIVAAKCSNHYGICGYYTLMAAEKNMIGFTCTNTSPLMAPTGSCKSALGTNPLSLGMAGSCDDQFILDMATTSVALGKIELAMRKGEKIPDCWALGSDGKPTTDPKIAFENSLLMPLGGSEEHSGYKGYGLSLMVEVLCGILSGSEYGPNIREWKKSERIANLGHCFIAINPEVFAPGSKDRLANLLKQLRELPKAGDRNVMVAGDPERMAMAKVDKNGGIQYHENQIKHVEEFAKEMGVEPMKLIPIKC